VNNQSQKKRRIVIYVGDLEGHFSSYMITASFEENKGSQVHASVNVVTSEDPRDPKYQSPLIRPIRQILVKTMVERKDPRKIKK
jgi:hypothetical protein